MRMKSDVTISKINQVPSSYCVNIKQFHRILYPLLSILWILDGLNPNLFLFLAQRRLFVTRTSKPPLINEALNILFLKRGK